MDKPLRAAIVGLNAEHGWARVAHIPALRSEAGKIAIVGVANRSISSARAAATAFGIERAFASVDELVASPDVDLVIVTVRVAEHHAVVSAALRAGKSVYCEWPLGNGLPESVELAKLAATAKGRTFIGTQAVASPEISVVRDLVREGFIGEVLSSTYLGSGLTWGSDVLQHDIYAMSASNGATLLSVIGGHALAAIQSVLGPVVEVGASLSRRRDAVRVIETGEMVPTDTHDHIMVHARMKSGVPLNLELRGGVSTGTKLLWEIRGSAGEIRVSAEYEAAAAINISPLRVEVARKGDPQLRQIEMPQAASTAAMNGVESRNVAALYARVADDLATGSLQAPDFAAAVEIHRVLDAIERADALGRRIRLDGGG